MKNSGTIATIVLLLFISFSEISLSEQIPDKVLEIGFDYPAFNTKDGYDQIKITGTMSEIKYGHPILPLSPLQIPVSNDIDRVEVSYSTEKLEGFYNILPGQRFQIISKPEIAEEPFQNPDVYNLEIYPTIPYEILGVSSSRDEKILSLNIYPIQHTKERTLIFHRNFTIKIYYKKNSGLKTMNIPSPLSDSYYNCPGIRNWEETELNYIIITNDTLKNEFQRLADWKTKKGVPAKVVRISEEILNASDLNCSGADIQEKIKSLINDTYRIYNLSYVLLGGDTNIVPHRGGWVKVISNNVYIDNVTTDLYYADLDSNWDLNEDGIYGNASQDGVGYYYDVYIGRAPVDTIQEAQIFVNKTLMYEKNPPKNYVDDILLLGAKLDDSTWGEDAMEATIQYYPSSSNITKRYESGGNSTLVLVNSSLNEGPYIANHAGHGSKDSFEIVWKSSSFTKSNADSLINYPRNFFFYSIACNINQFDSDSITENLMNNPNGGTFALVGNTRYGWYAPNSADEYYSIDFDKQFFNYMYNRNYYTLGKILAKSKESFKPIAEDYDETNWNNVYRWIYYETNLLGDPELPIYKRDPENLTIIYPNILNSSDTFTIHIQNSTEHSIPNAHVTIQGNGIYKHNYTDSNGNISFSLTEAKNGTYINITVTAFDYIPNESSGIILDTIAPKYFAYGINATKIYRSQSWLAYANWDDVNSSITEYNITNNLMNFSTLILASNWTNHTNATGNDWLLGSHSVRFYINDSANNWNYTPYLSFELWGFAKVNESMFDSSINEDTYTIKKCQIIDANLSQPVENYLVSFYSNGTALGQNITDNQGFAMLNFTIENPGIYEIKCNISSNQTLYYDPSEKNFNISILTVNDVTPPTWINNKTYPANPAYYNQFHQFNITWADANIYEALFEWNNAINYSYRLGNISVSGNEYYLNLSLKPGNYTYRWIANDTLGNENATDIFVYNISKAVSGISLYFNGTEGSKTYVKGDMINITAVLNASHNISLYSNFSGYLEKIGEYMIVINITNSSLLNESTAYNISANFSGNENYTESFKSYLIGICPVCPSATAWNSCTGTQSRTNYRCTFETNLTCEAYTETQGCSLGGNGGSSSSISTPKIETKIVTAYQDNLVNVSINIIQNNATISVQNQTIEKVLIQVSKEVKNVILEMQEILPVSLPEPEGVVYKYLEVKSNINSADIKSINFDFSVEKSWIDENTINANTIKLMRYDNGWKELETSKLKEDDQKIYFTAVSPGLSYFSISAKKLELAEKEINITSGITSNIIEESGDKKMDINYFNLILAIMILILSAATIYVWYNRKKFFKYNKFFKK